VERGEPYASHPATERHPDPTSKKKTFERHGTIQGKGKEKGLNLAESSLESEHKKGRTSLGKRGRYREGGKKAGKKNAERRGDK